MVHLSQMIPVLPKLNWSPLLSDTEELTNLKNVFGIFRVLVPYREHDRWIQNLNLIIFLFVEHIVAWIFPEIWISSM